MNFGAQLAVPAFVGVFNTVLLAVFIYATAPASGGHMNPMITFATFLCGLCPAPRAFAYIMFQSLGAALGGGLLRGSWGLDMAVEYAVCTMSFFQICHVEYGWTKLNRTRHHGTGCFFNTETISIGQVFLTEFMSSKILL